MSERAPSGLYRLHQEPPTLDSPVLVMAPEGWIDAGLGGGAAMAALLAGVPTEPVATFDSDILLDHRARRPVARIVDGVYEELLWPEIQLRAGKDAAGHDLLALVGPEPDNQWRAFAAAVGELAVEMGVRLAVGMGAFPAPVPHTRPVPLAATATTAELAARVGVVPGSLEVPAGVIMAIHRHLGDLGLPAIALWARVPHYAAGMPYPAASLLLLEGLAEVAGITVDLGELRESAAAVADRLGSLVANSMEHRALVAQLEAQVDAAAAEKEAAVPGDWGTVPSGDDLAAEVERYLRDQGA